VFCEQVAVLVALEIDAALFKVACALTNSGCNIREGHVTVSLPVLQCINGEVPEIRTPNKRIVPIREGVF
jgi:hypothetical protein